jgi:hypothetical protein
MPEPGVTTMAMPVSSNEGTRVFPAAPGPHLGTGRPAVELLGGPDLHDERALSQRMSMQVLETHSRSPGLAGDGRGTLSIGLVG